MRTSNPRRLRIRISDPARLDDLPMVRRHGVMPSILATWRALWCLVFLALVVAGGVFYALWENGLVLQKIELASTLQLWNWGNTIVASTDDGQVEEPPPPLPTPTTQFGHPIEHLMHIAEKSFRSMLSHQSTSLPEAAAKYREKRGRHPPPGFDAWYQYAVSNNATIVEDFWDQIYDDLRPLWNIETVALRKQTHIYSPKISIRNGTVASHTFNLYKKLDMWADMLKTLGEGVGGARLPDVDIPFSVQDEPAMLVPWETIDTAVSFARIMLIDPAEAIDQFTGLGNVEVLSKNFEFDPEWLGARTRHPQAHFGPRPVWSLVRPSCAPHSPARGQHILDDIWDYKGQAFPEHSAAALLPEGLLNHTLQGFAGNWTSVLDACNQPNMQGLHSGFVAPVAMSMTTKLFPLFGDSKLSMSNEILIPGGNEWNMSAPASLMPEQDSTPWASKATKLQWRGSATKAREPERYWHRLQRHRLVSMLNSTHAEFAQATLFHKNKTDAGIDNARCFRLLPANDHGVVSQANNQLADWVGRWSDVAFTDLECDVDTDDGGCPYLDEYFSIVNASTIDAINSKYAIVVDGVGGDDGGELTRTLLSERTTLRTSIYRKWYDSRLVPWLHFVPLDNTLYDLYPVMEYFLGPEVAQGVDGKSEQDTVILGKPNTLQNSAAPDQSLPGVVPSYEEKAISTASQTSDGALDTGNEPHHFKDGDRVLNRDSKQGHDAAAEKIAVAGRKWSAQVLRREDMLVYMYRLLLEYARLVDDKRHRLGYVADLLNE